MRDESAYISFYGINVHFHTYIPDTPPRARIMILTSPFISTFHWRKLLPELNELNCLTCLVDLPGFGRSSCREDTPQDNDVRANMVWGILDAVDEDTGSPASTWHLMAHGTACPTIMEMTALCPDSVRSQVHVSPMMRAPEFKKATPDQWFTENVGGADAFKRTVVELAGYPMDDYIVDRMRKPLLRPGADRTFAHMIKAARKAPECGIGFCPTMVLMGGRDPLHGDSEVRECLKGAEMHTLRSAGHFPMETHSKALRDYLRGWILYNEQ